MKNRSLYLLVALLFFAIGFSVHSARKKRSHESQAQTLSKLSAKSQDRVIESYRDREILTLTQEIKEAGGVEEWLRWLAVLENASAQDLPRFLDNLPDNSAALDVLLDRWIEVGPEHCFAYLLGKFQDGDFGAAYLDKDRSLSTQLFRKWADKDLDGAIAALDEVEEFPYLSSLQWELAERLTKVDYLRAILYAQENHLFTSESGRMTFGGGRLKKWIRKDPAGAASLLMSIESRRESLDRIGLKELSQEWSKVDPRGAMQFALSKENEIGRPLVEDMFSRWSKRDFAAASDWLAEETSDELAEYLTPSLIETWSQSDPEGALQWTQDSLEGSLLENSLSRILIESAFAKDSNPSEILAQIQNPEARRAAAVALAKALWGAGKEQDPRRGLLKNTMEERVAWFDEVTEPSTFNKIARDLIGEGIDGDIGFLKEMAQSSRASILSENNANNLLDYVARKEPEEALELVENFRPSYQSYLKSSLLIQWMRQDAEAVEQWVQGEGGVAELHPQLARFFVQRLRRSDQEFAIRQLKGVSDFLRESVGDELRRYQAGVAALPEDFEGRENLPDYEKFIEVVLTGKD